MTKHCRTDRPQRPGQLGQITSEEVRTTSVNEDALAVH